MSVVLLWLIIDIFMYFFLPIDQQMANDGLFCWKVEYSYDVFSNEGVDKNWKWNFMSFVGCFIKIVTEITAHNWFEICE